MKTHYIHLPVLIAVFLFNGNHSAAIMIACYMCGTAIPDIFFKR